MHSQASHQIASPGPIKLCSLTLLTSPISCAMWHIHSSNLLPLGGPYALSQEHLAEVTVSRLPSPVVMGSASPTCCLLEHSLPECTSQNLAVVLSQSKPHGELNYMYASQLPPLRLLDLQATRELSDMQPRRAFRWC